VTQSRQGSGLPRVAAWEAADLGQRSRLVAGIFDQLEAEALPEGRIRVVAVPRPAWRHYFECFVVERHTLSCSNFREIREQMRELAALLG
jgi:hypothetical protein